MGTSLYSIQDTGGIISKNDIILGAFSQLRISGITRQPTPEDLELALIRLEDMAAQFNTTMPVGFNFEDVPDPNSDAGIPRALKIAFETGLAIRLIPDYNKEVPQALALISSGALSHMASLSAMQRIQGVQYPSRMPIGSGNDRYSRWARFYGSYSIGALPINSSNVSMFIGDKNTFSEKFDAYLKDGETIVSFSIVADSGLTLSDQSNTDTEVLYTVLAGTPSSSDTNNVLQITIIATTSLGRIETRRNFIEVVPRL